MSRAINVSNLLRWNLCIAFISVTMGPLQALANVNQLQSDVSKILNTRALNGADVSVVVRSLKSDKNIFERNANQQLNPASNVKLITTLAALYILKPEFRFQTKYFSDGRNLYVKGLGDPSITTERLRSVAHQLKLRGISKIEGDLVLDESFFDSQNYAKGHDKERNNTKVWAAPISALSLNRNAFEMFVRPTRVGEPAFVSVEPQSEYFQTLGTVKSVRNGYSPRVTLSNGNGSRMKVVVGGVVGVGSEPKSFYRRVANPTAYFGETFRSLLIAENILVKGNVRIGLTPDFLKPVYTDLSPRLVDVVNETNKQSSNFMAEMLVKAIAGVTNTPATFADGLAEIRRFLETKVGIRRGEYVLGNGSGLNDANQFSAAQLVKVLEFATRDFEIASEFISSLSVAGAQGTLSRRLKDPFMHRQLRAKTGTLSGVSALSGYLPGEKDDVLMFAIMFDGHHSSAHKMTQLQDEISRKLAKEFRVIEPSNIDSSGDDGYDSDDIADGEDDSLVGGG